MMYCLIKRTSAVETILIITHKFYYVIILHTRTDRTETGKTKYLKRLYELTIIERRSTTTVLIRGDINNRPPTGTRKTVFVVPLLYLKYNFFYFILPFFEPTSTRDVIMFTHF